MNSTEAHAESRRAAEQHRLECEARTWLRLCDYDPQRIRAKLAQLEKKRGNVDKLREEMRKQWPANIQSISSAKQ